MEERSDPSYKPILVIRVDRDSAIRRDFYFRCKRKQYRLANFITDNQKCYYNYPHDDISDMARNDPTRY